MWPGEDAPVRYQMELRRQMRCFQRTASPSSLVRWFAPIIRYAVVTRCDLSHCVACCRHRVSSHGIWASSIGIIDRSAWGSCCVGDRTKLFYTASEKSLAEELNCSLAAVPRAGGEKWRVGHCTVQQRALASKLPQHLVQPSTADSTTDIFTPTDPWIPSNRVVWRIEGSCHPISSQIRNL